MKLRSWRLNIGLPAICWLLPGIVWAQQTANIDGIQWLQRVAASAEKLNYGGVFVYRSGSSTETSRISHFLEGGKEHERLEVLDGSPREVVRDSDETRCFLPESRLVIVERHSTRRTFPSLPGGLGSLSDYYAIRKGPTSRVAGYEAQLLNVDAKDDLRYSRQFWVEANSGLLLKAVLLGDRGDARESFAFTELKIGGVADKGGLAAQSKAGGGDWRVQNVKVTEADGDLPWTLRAMVPGFRLVSGMRRQTSTTAPEVTHLVLTDGLAAISVFVEPMGGRPRSEAAAASVGAMNVYRRSIGDVLVTVIGDVPPVTLKRVADNLELKRK